MRTSIFTVVMLGTIGFAFSMSSEVPATTFSSLRSLSFPADVIAVKSDKDGGGKSGQMKSGGGPTGPQQLKGPPPGPQLYKSGPKPQDLKVAPETGPRQYQKVGPQFAPQKDQDGSKSTTIKWVAPKKVPKHIQWVHGHRYHGAYFIVPFGASLYANHYCYDWFYGPYGSGYYWNYDRCPIYDDWW
jgi:hypothetical protein